MKAKQLLILFSILGLVSWVYFLYTSIPFVSHINFKTIKLILEFTFAIKNLITPAGFLLALIMTLINKKNIATLGGIISLITPVYLSINVGYFEIEHIVTIICSIFIIIIGLFGKKFKLK